MIRLLPALALLLVLLPPAAGAVTLRVGPGEAFERIADAARAARDGDTVAIKPGRYRADTAVWRQDRLTLRGTGPGVILEAAGAAAQGKAIWVVRGEGVRIEGITFRGARVPDGNGAGIRFERGSLTVARCRFEDNENGLLAGNDPAARLRIEASVFTDAPRHPGRLHHLLYVGRIARFELEGSRIGGGFRGHLVKSRARENLIRYNWIDDGPAGQASYALEFPDGGLAQVEGNVIGQSARPGNAILVRHGAEGLHGSAHRLELVHNTLVSRTPVGWLLKVDHPDRTLTRLEANLFIGSRRIEAGATAGMGRNHALTYRHDQEAAGTLPRAWYRDAPTIEQPAVPPPARQFDPPAGTRPIAPGTPPRAGALQQAP
jgi:hypothetical protein